MADFASLRLEAEAGDSRARVLIAHASLLGRELPHAPEYALRLLDAACDQNFPEALLLRAALSIMGLATPRDFDEAFRLLSRAAKFNAYANRQRALLSNERAEFNLDVWSAKPDVTQHFDAPRIFTFKNFIPGAACDWLIAESRDRLQATQVHTETGPAFDADRNNMAAPTSNWGMDLVQQMINLRIAGTTGTPLLNQESANILHYAPGQHNKLHFDFISGDNVRVYADELKLVGQRVGTFLIYLNEDYEGGETEFPRLDWRFKGETGDALFFWNVSAQGEPELLSRHAGGEVTRGEKWVLSKWIRSRQVPLWWPAPPEAEN